MTTFFLIRHGMTAAAQNVLCGRAAGVVLSEVGVAQVEALAAVLAPERIDAVFSGPLERVQRTAQILAPRWQVAYQVRGELNEIDFGLWTGQTFEQLHTLPLWQRFNAFRTGTRIPRGELITDVQARVVSAIEELRNQYPDRRVALVTHGDVIRSALCGYLGIPLDLMGRLKADLASASALRVDDHGAEVLYVNRQALLPATGMDVRIW